ncbi:hypothetical protein VOLCADRAFT_90656 [Volvox carteri f. nagariensis]|uniref:Uncharacterized protein n=1 Tax=Volvox carteri f. nagariensis TaxID=3068 RepID=D8TUZ6_VOLCA|nr:uncharacterized protein VOLCADRAFT_90656 [Volvox carteri f. nagariensis]EFJ48799.1 hypothetical protein VOLCADRAFT_90656 [Volvox carteri f. nagariensis]|eukprot:XP_002950131.1 hypothetical protein VOLCADRAFT_90656 [Volvox carteri f. nagariensis]
MITRSNSAASQRAAAAFQRGQTAGSASAAVRRRPASFSYWLARRAYRADLLFLSVELLATSAPYITKVISFVMCAPAGGGVPAGLPDLQPPLNPAARRVDAVLSGYPCGDSYLAKLLYVLRTGAILDVQLRWRLCDYASCAHVLTQLLALGIAVAAPSVYFRLRHFLFVAITVSVLLGVHVAAASAPEKLLLAMTETSSVRRRTAAIYFGWKTGIVLQLPSSQQLLFGPLLGLLFLSTTLAVDGRLLAPSAAGDAAGVAEVSQLGAGQAALVFFGLAVLPYLVVRFYERIWLLPQYSVYLRSRGVDNGAGGGGGRCSESGSGSCERLPGGCTASHGNSNEEKNKDVRYMAGAECDGTATLETLTPADGKGGAAVGWQPQAKTATTTATTTASDGRQDDPAFNATNEVPLGLALQREPAALSASTAPAGLTALTGLAAPSEAGADPAAPLLTAVHGGSEGILYQSAYGNGRTHVVSIKVPLPPGRDFATAAAQLIATATAAINSARAAGGVNTDEEGEQQEWGGGGEAAGGRRPVQVTASSTTFDRSDAAASRQTMRLLSLVCVEGCVQLLMVMQVVGPRNDRNETEAEPSSSHAIRLQSARQSQHGQPPADSLETSGVDVALRDVLTGVFGGHEAGRREPGTSARAARAAAEGDVRDVADPQAAPALLWPPVLSHWEPGRRHDADVPPAAIGTTDEYDISTYLPGNTEGASALAVVVILLPARALRGRTSVRCVVSGPMGRCGRRQQVLLDAELSVEQLGAAGWRRRRLSGGGGGGEGRAHPGSGSDGSVDDDDSDSEVDDGQGASEYLAVRSTNWPFGGGAQQGTTGAAAYATDTETAASAGTPSADVVDAPLAMLPLLVLPSDAAAEVRQLYGSVFDGGAATVMALDRLLFESRAGAPDMGRGSTASTTRIAITGFDEDRFIAAAVAAKAQHRSGLIGFAYDIGCLLAEFYSATGALPEPPTLAADPRVVNSLLDFLRSWRMAACLREVHHAMLAMGLRTTEAITDPNTVAPFEDAALTGGCGRGSGCGGDDRDPSRVARTTSGGVPSADPLASSEPTTSHSKSPPGSRSSSNAGKRAPWQWPHALPRSRLLTSSCMHWWSPSPSPSPSSPSSRPPPPPPPPPLPLLVGFSPPARELAYQEFKAARCGHLDRMGLLLAVLMPLHLLTAIRTYRSKYGQVLGAAHSTHTHIEGVAAATQQCWSPRGFPPGIPSPPSPSSATSVLRLRDGLELKLVSHGIHLVPCLIPLVLALFTSVHARHRNRLLLLRAFLDYGALTLIFLPGPWGDTLLPVPESWMEAGRSCGGHWPPAIVFAACTAAAQLLLSVITDWHTRRKFQSFLERSRRQRQMLLRSGPGKAGDETAATAAGSGGQAY